MSAAPLVSVIIATYNRPRLLRRAIKSALRQTYENTEIVVVDDASAERASLVLDTFSDDRIRYFRNEHNVGFAGTINRAARLAHGDYLAILGDDDEWFDSQKLARQAEILSADRGAQVAVVCTGFQYVEEESAFVRKRVIPEMDNLLERLLVRNSVVASSTAVVRRNVWEELNGCSEAVPRGVDSDFFRRVLFAGYQIESIPELMVNVYVGRADRMSARESVGGIQEHVAGEEYKLKTYPEIYACYPSAKSLVLQKIARHQFRAWRYSRRWTYLVQALVSCARSIFISPANCVVLVKSIRNAGRL